jgi:hypothetical protein
MRVMMYADLIDQEDLLGQLKALGIQVPSGTTADQACECAVRGLDNVRAFELRKMVKDMYTSGASIQPAVRQAIDKQLLPALADYSKATAPDKSIREQARSHRICVGHKCCVHPDHCGSEPAREER